MSVDESTASFGQRTSATSPLVHTVTLPRIVLQLGVAISSSISVSDYQVTSEAFKFSARGADSADTISSLSQDDSFKAFSPDTGTARPVVVSLPTPISPIGVLDPSLGSASISMVETEFFAYEFYGVRSPSAFPGRFCCYSAVFQDFFVVYATSSSMQVAREVISSPTDRPAVSYVHVTSATTTATPTVPSAILVAAVFSTTSASGGPSLEALTCFSVVLRSTSMVATCFYLPLSIRVFIDFDSQVSQSAIT